VCIYKVVNVYLPGLCQVSSAVGFVLCNCDVPRCVLGEYDLDRFLERAEICVHCSDIVE